LPTLGIQQVTWSDEEVARLRQASHQVQEELTGHLYTPELLERVRRQRDQYRQGRAQ
jgi:hypothetical protein